MTASMNCPPVLVLAFNRPDTTQRVIETLSAARPSRIFFGVDGPRPDRQGEDHAVGQVRALADSMDWGCEVRTLFRESNLGCKLAVSQAISWFFSQVESGIILEDDCIAHPSFFPFAAELLERYRDDERIMMISGDNFQGGRSRTGYSYYFSRYTHIWGWATWRRAWSLYDHRMTAWPEMRDRGWLEDVLHDRRAARYWARIFDDTHDEKNTSWAYRWQFAAWSHGMLSVLPNVNLVSNIGFGDAATHTLEHNPSISNLDTAAVSLPLRHPTLMIPDQRSDGHTERTMFSGPGLLGRVIRRARRSLPLFRHGAAA